jgi:hypothetical protein
MAVSSGYFPMMWPTPGPVQLTLHTGPATFFEVPLRTAPPGRGDPVPEHFAKPEAAAELEHTDLVARGGDSVNRVTSDAGSGGVELVMGSRDRHVRIAESGLEYREVGRSTFSVVDGDPLSACARSEQSHLIARGSWRTRVDTRSTMSATADEFVLSNELDAFEGDERVFSKVWRTRIPRDFT